jgi:hypothetical protein
MKGENMRGFLYRVGAVVASIGTASVISVSGIAAAQGIGFTGPFSNNTINRNNALNANLVNNNNIGVNNTNAQNALTGDATVAGNTLGGNAISGPAGNWNNTGTNIGITNSGFPGFAGFNARIPGGWSIYGTGPFSNNQIGINNLTNLNRINNNSVGVNNTNLQNAVSGPAMTAGNLFGGNAISGPASNWNNTNTNVGIHNF